MSDVPSERVDDLFIEALDRPREARAAFLDEACGDDAALRARVEAMIAAHDRAGGFLETPAIESELAQLSALAPGERVGQYVITRAIATGGMGVVYEAEQQQPKRTVALKVIRPEVASPSMLRRFELEAEVLGRLTHPGIARIYDAGLDDAGNPFFAMEYVDGAPLIDYAESRGLSTRERLTLLAKVCDAVHHAHQKGVIHRDLKPQNIIVTDDGQPKVLDFGVARAVDGDIRLTTQRTEVGQLIGTMPYMSPEQVSGDATDLDIRSDVYALGVVGYELLAGRLPYDLRKPVVHEMIRVIREEEPSRLSTVDVSLRGDVETIIAHALEKEPERRYQSANHFASDIHRYLTDVPIDARPASVIYQVRKFARRNRALVGATVAIAVTVVAALVATSILYVEARAARDAERAAKEAAVHEATVKGAVLDYLADSLFAPVDVDHDPDPEITLAKLLEDAPDDLDTRFADEPIVAAFIHRTIGNVWRNLGELDRGGAHLERTLELLSAELGPEHPTTLTARIDLTLTTERKNRRAAIDELLAIEAVRSRVLGAEHRDTLRTQYERARMLDRASLNDTDVERGRGMRDEAIAILETLLVDQERLFGADDRQTLDTVSQLGTVHYDQLEFTTAEPYYRRALDGRRALLGDEHPMTIRSVYHHALVLKKLERHVEAAEAFEAYYATSLALYGREHPTSQWALHHFATFLRDAERFGDLDELYAAEIEWYRTYVDRIVEPMTVTLNNLGSRRMMEGKFEDAVVLLEEALAVRRRVLEPGSYQLGMSLHALASCYFELGRFDEALTLADEAATFTQEHGMHRPWYLGHHRATLGKCLTAAGRYAEAETSLLSGHGILDEMLGERHAHTRRAMSALVDLYDAWDQEGKKQEWLDRLSGATAELGGG